MPKKSKDKEIEVKDDKVIYDDKIEKQWNEWQEELSGKKKVKNGK
jgi:hypothetical protein